MFPPLRAATTPSASLPEDQLHVAAIVFPLATVQTSCADVLNALVR